MRRFEKLSMLFAIVAASSLIFASGCGGCDDDDDPDARPPAPDADTTDAIQYDAIEYDAAPTSTHGGQLTLVDLELAGDRETSGGVPTYGHGLKHFFTFTELEDDSLTKIYDDRDAIGAGCAAWVYDLTADPVQSPPPDENHGTFAITGTTGTYPAACIFMGGDYLCPGASGDNDDGNLILGDLEDVGEGMGKLGAFTFTDTDGPFVPADAGMYISITAGNGMDNYPWTGAFPVIMYLSATTIVVGNGAPAAQLNDYLTGAPGIGITSNPLSDADGETTYVLVAGAGGPVPGGPEAIADDDDVIVSLDAPAGDAFEDFTTDPIPAGDAFSLPMATIGILTSAPTDGLTFTVGCNDDVASHTGDTDAAFTVDSDDVTITHTDAFAGVRVGAEVTITAATTGNNNGEYTNTAVTDDTITYVNANGAAEDFIAATGYAIDDCGAATLTGLSMEFNDGDLTTVLATHTGPTEDAAISDNGNGTMNIEHTGGFSPAYFGQWLILVNSTTSGNNLNFVMIIAASNNAVTVVAPGAVVEEVFAATTTYQVHKKISGLPDRSTATKLGMISCSSLTSTTLVVPAEASAAIATVDPTVIQSTFVRSALGIKTNANLTNRSNILVGHAFAGFTIIAD